MGLASHLPDQVSQPLSQACLATPNCSILPQIPRDQNTSPCGFHLANSHTHCPPSETFLSSPPTTTPNKVQMLEASQPPLPKLNLPESLLFQCQPGMELRSLPSTPQGRGWFCSNSNCYSDTWSVWALHRCIGLHRLTLRPFVKAPE